MLNMNACALRFMITFLHLQLFVGVVCTPVEINYMFLTLTLLTANIIARFKVHMYGCIVMHLHHLACLNIGMPAQAQKHR